MQRARWVRRLAGAGVIAAFAGVTYANYRRTLVFAATPSDKSVSLREVAVPSVPPREAHLDRLRRDDFDMLVIGAGATGSGVALVRCVASVLISSFPVFLLCLCSLARARVIACASCCNAQQCETLSGCPKPHFLVVSVFVLSFLSPRALRFLALV